MAQEHVEEEGYMAEPWEWQEADLKNLVDQQATEAIDLEFKRCAALDIATPESREKTKSDLSKDVSAFANSAGGTIVYGIIENARTHTARKLDRGYDPTEINHEWIGQVITSTIHPRLTGVRVHTIRLESSDPARVAYVVHVPQGSTAHQATDRRYYKRHNFESVPMEDYELRDVMHRASSPKVSIDVEIDGEKEGHLTFTKRSSGMVCPRMDIYTTAASSGDICEYSQHQVFVPAYLVVAAEGPVRDPSIPGKYAVPRQQSETTITGNGGSLAFNCFQFEYTPRDIPLFPGERRLLCSLTVEVPLGTSRRQFFVLWRIRAPRSEPTAGSVMFFHLEDEFWQFKAMTIPEIEEASNISVDLAP